MTKNLKVSEIFRSIQGEGPHIGTPSVFLRLSGCNLACPFCDTKYAWDEWVEMGAEHVVSEILRISDNSRMLIVTGGEPLLQCHQLKEVLQRLSTMFDVEVETNGTLNPIPIRPWVHHWIVSPKPETEIHPAFFNMKETYFKFLYGGEKCVYRLVDINEFVSEHGLDKSRVWISPLSLTRKEHTSVLAEAFRFALENGYNVSPRLQVMVYGKPKRGV